MTARVSIGLLLLVVCVEAAAADLYAAVNRLRAGEGACAVAGNLPPLQSQAALERAAGNLAQGGDLQQSLQASGYRATRSSFFSLRGEGVGARATSTGPPVKTSRPGNLVPRMRWRAGSKAPGIAPT